MKKVSLDTWIQLLGMVGAERALICYQMTEDKMKPLAAIRSSYRGTSFATVVDNFDSAKMLFDHFTRDSVEVYIDVDVGMHRTGLSIEKVPDLVEKIKKLKRLTIVGIHSYDGHVAYICTTMPQRSVARLYLLLLKPSKIYSCSCSEISRSIRPD